MEDFIETSEKYHSGFVVQEYRGTWSLVSAYVRVMSERE